MLQVFEEVYELALDADVNRVLFALPRESPVGKEDLSLHLHLATLQLQKIAEEFAPWKNGPNLGDFRDGKIRFIPRA